MKLYYIYVMLGIATLILNLVLTVHLFKTHKGSNTIEPVEEEDLITFRLTREHNAEKATTAAVQYDDTVPLGIDPWK